jgi:adenosylcobinamide-phosphate synthase
MTRRPSSAVLGAALAIDALLGEPPGWAHPVVFMGRAIAWCEKRAPGPERSPAAQLVAGAAMAIAVPAAFAAAARWIERRLPSGAAGVAAEGALLKTTFALRALAVAADGVRAAVDGERIDDARAGLRALCSRDPSALTAPELLAAAIESVAENTSDSVVAPLFWYAVAGLPGAAFYRAVNTLDAMVGYHGRYEWLGKASARLDDALNWIPARATALLLLAGGAAVGLDVRRGWRTLLRDGAKTESPNAGRPMAAMAGLLGVELTKRGHYRLGDATTPVEARHLTRALLAAGVAAALAAVATALVLRGAYGGARR